MGRRLELEWILRGSGSALDVPDPTTVLDTVGYPGAPDGDAEAFLKPDTVHNAFGQDLSEADRWLIVESQRPITLSANTTPSGAAAWKTLPSWVVVGTEDRVIPPDTQRHMAERAGATITDVAGSHVSMVSHPQATIAAILALWLGHEQTSTTNIYLHADMTHKQQAIDRTKPINTKPGRYQPTDTLLATKRSDYADLIEPRKRAEQPLPTDIGITRTSAYSWLCRRRHNHDRRHTFGTPMAAHGMPMRVLQELMGHRDFKTTLIYAPSEREAEWVEQAFRPVPPAIEGRAPIRQL